MHAAELRLGLGPGLRLSFRAIWRIMMRPRQCASRVAVEARVRFRTRIMQEGSWLCMAVCLSGPG